MKYLETNCYGLKPQYAEQITKQIKGDELQDLGVELIVTTGCIDGVSDEHGTDRTIKDTIEIYLNNELLGKLKINSTELSITPKCSFKSEDFIQVSFSPVDCHELAEYIIKGEKHVFATGYNFLVIHKSDLDKAKEIILNMLSWRIKKAQQSYEIEEKEFLADVKQKYADFID